MTDVGDWHAVMGRALGAATEASVARGDVPVGAVVVDSGGRVVSVAANRREADGDPTAHAEVVALRAAAAAAGSWRLDGYTLVVTLEPCVMCAGAALSARVSRVVFGAASGDGGALGSLYNVAADPRMGWSCEVVGGVRADESAALLRDFFEARR